MSANRRIGESLDALRTGSRRSASQFRGPSLDETVRQLQGLVARLESLAERVERKYQSLLTSSPTIDPIPVIVRAVCAEFGVERAQLFGRGREEFIIWPRHVAFLVARALTTLSFDQIGRAFKRDHGTVMSGVKTARNRMESEPKFQVRVLRVLDVVQRHLGAANVVPGPGAFDLLVEEPANDGGGAARELAAPSLNGHAGSPGDYNKNTPVRRPALLRKL